MILITGLGNPGKEYEKTRHILITGLGNPGKEYEKTRHSVGFLAIDAIATNFQFPIFKFQSIFNAQISKKTADNQEIILAKPQTFMNESGTAVEKFVLQNFTKTEEKALQAVIPKIIDLLKSDFNKRLQQDVNTK
ncbi:MAG: Peptidyl-tRNA hydrolase [Parcubacteria group bacterium GW2011_GWB1_43_6]|nr:MAG: Peptidyl-tRNA hydrolase [Parcubacteria group bacterium GW2011_GWB1_43_6]